MMVELLVSLVFLFLITAMLTFFVLWLIFRTDLLMDVFIWILTSFAILGLVVMIFATLAKVGEVL